MMKAPPVFIIGMNGSGTTMLADSLNRHPELYVFPRESKVLPYFLNRAERFGDLSKLENRRRLADAIGKSAPYWLVNRRKPLKLDDKQLRQCKSFGDVVSCLYMTLAARRDKYRWGEKSPSNTHHVSALAETFPDCKFIHIIRDGRDVAQSLHRRWGYNHRHTIWRWKCTVLSGRRQGHQLAPGRYLEISYDSLTASPEEYMRRICDFLGLQFDSAVLESSMRHMDAQQQDARSNQIVRNSRKWKGYFIRKQVDELEQLAGRLLTDLQFPDIRIEGDNELSPAKIRFLMLSDGLKYLRYLYRQFGMRSLLAYVLTLSATIRQWSVTKYGND